MLKAVIQRLRSHGVAGTVPYALGRFGPVRAGYGGAVAGLQRVGALPGLRPHTQATLFPGQSADALAREVRRSAAAFGLALPADVVAQLWSAAQQRPLLDWGTRRELLPNDVSEGRMPDGTPVFVADVVGADLVPAARRVALDPLLLGTIGAYLGYQPIGVDVRLLRSFVVDAPVEQRRRAQTIDYHFDVHGFNFTYANFYVSDVDQTSGAHEMVLGSHRDKPVAWLFSSARKSDEQILEHYGADRIKTIVGPAGTGFVQDSSCYHRVLAPTARERVMLHLRYY